MPFMKGVDAFRYTLRYLQAGKIVFKPDIRVMVIHYNTEKPQFGSAHKEDTSQGVRDMIYWHIDQLQYKNPLAQIITMKDLTPTPFISFILGNGYKFQVDVEGKHKDDILTHLREIVGKTDEDLQEETPKPDLSKFGDGGDRWCICEVPGQVPCPAYVQLPNHMRGKYKWGPLAELQNAD